MPSTGDATTTADDLRNIALHNDARNPSSLTEAVLWLAAEVRELRLIIVTDSCKEES